MAGLSRFILVPIYFLAICSGGSAVAQVDVFTGTGANADWFTAANWSLGAPPDSDGDAQIGGAVGHPGNYSALISGGFTELNSLVLGSGTNSLTIASETSLLTGTVSLGAGATLTLGTGGANAGFDFQHGMSGQAGSTIVGNFTDYMVFFQQVTGTVDFHLTNTGTLELWGTGPASGTMTVDAGALILSGSDVAQHYTVAINADQGLKFGSGWFFTTIHELTGTGGFQLNTVDGDGVELTLGTDNNSFAYSGSIGGVGSLIKVGSGTLTLGGASTFTGGLTLNGGEIDVSSAANLGGDTNGITLSSGTLRTMASFTSAQAYAFQGGDLIVDPGTTLTLTGNLSGDQGLKQRGGGNVDIEGLYLSSGGSIDVTTGTLTVGASAYVDSAIAIGDGGSGTSALMLVGGGTMQSSQVAIGYTTPGEATVSGPGSFWFYSSTPGGLTLPHPVVIGYGASGALTITDGALVDFSVFDVQIGSPGVQGTLDLSGTGSNLMAGDLEMDGPSRLTVEDGANFYSSGTVMLDSAEGVLFAVTGSHSTAQIDLELLIAQGTAQVDDGGSLSTGFVNVGSAPAATGTLTVTGAQSVLDVVGGPTIVGGSGTGVLTISDGAQSLTNGEGIIGQSAGSSGFVTLTGTNSLWQSTSSPLIVGQDGTGHLTVEDGATLDFENGIVLASGSDATGTIEQTGGTVGVGELNFGSGSASYLLEQGALQIYGAITGTSANSGFEIAGGTVQAMADYTSSVAAVLQGAATFDNNGHFVTWSGNLSGTGSLALTGGNVIELSGSNSFTGGTVVDDQTTLQVGSSHFLSPDGLLTINSGTLDLNGWSTTLGPLATSTDAMITSASPGGVLTLDLATDTTLNAAIQEGSTGGTVGLVKTGTATLTLAGTNAYTGGNTINDGTVKITGSDSLGGSLNSLTVNSGTLDLNGVSTTSGPLSGSDGGVITNNGDTAATFTVSQGNTTYEGAINDGAQTVALSLINGAAITLSGSSNYSGGTIVTDSSIVVGNLAALGGATRRLQLIDSTLDVNGNDFTVGEFSGDVSSVVRNDSGVGTFIVDQDTDTTFAGSIFDGAGLLGFTKTGTGTLDLTSAYGNLSGALRVDNGELRLSAGTAVTTGTTSSVGDAVGSIGTLQITDASSLVVAADLAIGGAGEGHLVLSSGGVVQDAFAEIGGASGTSDVLVTGALSEWLNTGGLEIGHDGAGAMTVSGGYVSDLDSHLGEAGDAPGTALVTGTGSTWAMNSLEVGVHGAGTVTVADGGLVSVDSGTILLATNADATGTLNIGNGAAAGSLSATEVNGGSGTATVNFNTTDAFTFSLNLTGAMSVNQLGTGTTTLTGLNTFTGTTTVSTGVLVGSSDSFPGDIVDNASVVFDQVNDGAYAGVLSGSGAVTKQNDGALSFSASNPYTGGTLITAGTLIASADGALGTGTVHVQSGLLSVAQNVAIANHVSLEGGTYEHTITGGASLANAVNATSHLGGADTAATVLSGTASTDLTLTTSFAKTSIALNDEVRLSDIYSFHGTDTDIFVLQLSVTSTAPNSYLAWLNGANRWVNAVAGNTDNNATAEEMGFLGDFAAFQAMYGTDLALYLGAWGRSVIDGVVIDWAVLNHNSDFAVATTPEPSTWALILLSIIALLFLRRRGAAL